MPSLGVIVNTFNQPEYLARVWRALLAQTSPADEVLVADDGSDEPTRAVVQSWSSAVKVLHVWQSHDGFRRARILNEAIVRARSDYLVFLDGDTLPHPRFVADHRQIARVGTFVQGHRALLKEKAARWFGLGNFNRDRARALLLGQVEGLKHAFRWPVPLVRKRLDLRGIRGCNLGIWRDDLVKINGYNEAFTGWGREDSELALRLMNLGRVRLDLRGRALCYHLWHPPASRAGLAANDELLAKAREERSTWAVTGLSAHFPAGKCPSDTLGTAARE